MIIMTKQEYLPTQVEGSPRLGKCYQPNHRLNNRETHQCHLQIYQMELRYAQKSRLITILAGPKSAMLQWALGNSAVGWSQLDASTVEEPPDTSAGKSGEFLDQSQTLMAVGVRSSAYHAPPALLDERPKLFGSRALTPQSALLLSKAEQSVDSVILEMIVMIRHIRGCTWDIPGLCDSRVGI